MSSSFGLGCLKVPQFTAAVVAGLALLSACDEPTTEAVVPATASTQMAADAAPKPPAPPAERPQILYTAVGPEAESYGLLTVLLPPGGVGEGRTLSFAKGPVFEMSLLSSADITKPIGSIPMSSALGVSEKVLSNGGDPRTYLLKVSSEVPPPSGEKACGPTSPTYALIRQLDTPDDPTLTLVLLAGQPGEEAATVCKKLVYTRS